MYTTNPYINNCCNKSCNRIPYYNRIRVCYNKVYSRETKIKDFVTITVAIETRLVITVAISFIIVIIRVATNHCPSSNNLKSFKSIINITNPGIIEISNPTECGFMPRNSELLF